ncbi:MAG: M23 family metallopeptidase [Fretibacterium sp.]|nr:M23 family metallopeptidase [Fretibacterium sp.]
MIRCLSLCHRAMGYFFFLILAAAALILTQPGHAATLQTMTFTADHDKDMEAFLEFCLLHDVSSADVLWANNCTLQDLKPGREIYLPASQAQMLVVWQKQGSWQPKTLVKKTSAALAERSRGVSGYPPVAQKQPAPAAPAASPAPEAKAPGNSAPVPASTPVPSLAPVRKAAPKKPSAAPASSKPDKELKAREKDEEKYTDPILLLSAEGDATSGPMRLIISGDRVEIVRLPPRAIPKTPSLANLNAFSPSLLPPTPIQPSGRLGARMLWPVNGAVSSYFGKRGNRFHAGIDIPMPSGTPIRAARDGVVAATGTNSTPGFRGYGNFVLIDHGGNLRTLYAHCLKVNVRKGQHIRQGQVIATVGRTGRSTSEHLHFEVRVRNKAVDPLPYLQNVRLARKR